MAGVPAGMVSFLYNVINDAEFQERFGKDSEGEEEVMEFFQVPVRVKEVVRKISELERKGAAEFKKERDKLRGEISKAKNKNTKAPSKNVQLLMEQLGKQEDAYVDREVVPKEDMDVVLEALREELNGGGYRRFW